MLRYSYKIIHEELNMKNCRSYDISRSYARKGLRSGVEIRDVADILSHSKIEATGNYYITTTEEMAKSDVIDEIIKHE